LLRPSPDMQERLAKGDQGPGTGIVRVDLQRLATESNGDFQVSQAMLYPVIATKEIELISFGILGRPALDCLLLRRQQPDLQRRNDGLRDLVLQREDIVEVAVIALTPDVAVIARVDQLRRDPHTAARLAHAAFDDIFDLQPLSYL